MTTIVALVHIIGAVLASTALGVGVLSLNAWRIERVKKRSAEELALHLGVTVAALEGEEMIPQVVRYYSDRFSSELLRNRLSDLCGTLRTAWDWLGVLIHWGVLAGVVWFAFTDRLDTAIYAWAIIPLSLFFVAVSFAWTFLCLLLTGRYPGQARLARKGLTEIAATHQRVKRSKRRAYDDDDNDDVSYRISRRLSAP